MTPDALVVEQYGAGESVMDAGDEPRFLVVAAGEVEATHDDPHGLTVRRGLLGPGTYLGHEALGTARTETPTVRTVTPATLLVLTRSRWETLGAADATARSSHPRLRP